MRFSFPEMAILLILGIISCGGGTTSSSVPSNTKTWVTQNTGSLAQARDRHTATLLPNGKVLIIGGESLSVVEHNPVAMAELYDPQTKTFTPAGNLVHPRLGHSSLLLPSGKVVVLGGYSINPSTWDRVLGLSAVEEWDPSSMSFSVIGTLINERSGSHAVLRQDGKIEVIGGFDVSKQLDMNSYYTETFDPNTGISQLDFALSELETGSVLVQTDGSHFMLMGGENGLGFWHQLDGSYLYSTDGSSPNPSAGGAMPYAFTAAAGVNLPIGKVVVAGGQCASAPANIKTTGSMISEAIVIDYKNIPSSFVLIQLINGRINHQTILFPDGTVGLVGGETFTGSNIGSYLSDIEILDVNALKTSTLTTTLKCARTLHTVTPLNDGSFLIVGGYGFISPTGSVASLNLCELLLYN